MKKLLSYADILVAVCGIGGAALRAWMLSDGTDSKGLYPAFHPGWVGLLMLTAAVFAFLWFVSRQEGPIHPGKPVFHGVGAFVAAAALAQFGFTRLESTLPIVQIAGVLCLAAGVSLALWGVATVQGRKPYALSHALPCLAFALLMFLEARGASRTTELSRYVLQLAAYAATAIAFYQQWGMDVKAGDGSKCLFWRLCALYLCLIAAPGENPLLFSGVAIYHLLGNRNVGE